MIFAGLTFNHGHHSFWVNVPVRVHQDFKRSLADIEHNRVGGGDLAKYLLSLAIAFDSDVAQQSRPKCGTPSPTSQGDGRANGSFTEI
jgi:hypothetical protein